MTKSSIYILLLVSLLMSTVAMAQEKPVSLATIQKLIDSEQYVEADNLLQTNIRYFIAKKNIDTLVKQISLIGSITYGQKGANAAIADVYSYVDMLKAHKAEPRQLANAYNRVAFFFYNINEFREGYKAAEMQLASATKISPVSYIGIASGYYYMAEFASFLEEPDLALKHHRKAYEIRLHDKNGWQDDLLQSTEAMGKMMLLFSQPDSASVYYRKALSILAKMPKNSENELRQPAGIYKNLAIISNSEGKAQEAIQYSYKAISLLRQYINSKEAENPQGAKTDLCRTIDNLSIYYSQLGNVGRANDLLKYSYELKKATLLENSPEIMQTEVLLGSNYNNIGDYDKSRYYLNSAIQRARLMNGGELTPLADAWYIMATVNTNTSNTADAQKCFGLADSLYEIVQQGVYSDMYLDFTRNFCVFYAKNGLYHKALARTKDAYRYLKSTGKANSLQGFYQLLNIARVNYYGDKYAEAIRYSDLALEVLQAKLKDGRTYLDSVKWEVFKPQCVLTSAMATYEMQGKRRSIAFLRSLQTKLDNALQILERRKGILDDANSIGFLIENNRTLIDFSKKISMELHRLSGSPGDLEKFINLHESALYTRIRSRLDQEQASKFSHVPQLVLTEETRLKEYMKAALESENGSRDEVRNYLQAVKRWDAHLDIVKSKYPDYYNLRYATLFRSLPKLKSAIPPQTTLIRYYFVDSSLMALIADGADQKIISLSSSGLEDKVRKFLLHNSKEKEQLALLYDLYTQLWAPLASYVKTEKVIIVPDGILHSLGFDMLPFTRVNSFKQLRQYSLLARHTISYHYNLFMLEAQNGQATVANNYVGFAPGFSDELKKTYTDHIKDSLKMDHNYLTLLPQPTANAIAKKIRQLIGGDVYLENQSTQASFRKYAGNHKVIHIATHAEYNNNCPERSGLIFAKGPTGNDSNYIYLADIYNCNLNSDVTILTACESGRPGLQDGEGMVSLAHAFNYAGSKNILTALWKIDEQVSCQITESFIKYLKKGLATDEALRQSKLDYLERADGRLADPGYWAGLVLMGKPLKVNFSDETNFPVGWAAAGYFLLSGALLFVSFKRRNRAA